MTNLVTRLHECWKRIDPTETTDDPVGMSQASTLLAEAATALEDLQCEHDSLLRGRRPTHRCKVCSALWIRFPDYWSLFSRQCGQCCDNVAMGDQIEALPVLATYREFGTEPKGCPTPGMCSCPQVEPPARRGHTDASGRHLCNCVGSGEHLCQCGYRWRDDDHFEKCNAAKSRGERA